MRILLTGGSSFTGAWFACALANRGHEVSAILQRRPEDYTGIRAARLQAMTVADVRLVSNATFGQETFMSQIDNGFDVLCHHAADVTNYKSADFDISAAVSANTLNLKAVIERGKAKGLRAIVLTGSVFEPEEGIGEPALRAFSPYGLSKGLTSRIFAYFADTLAVPLGKFVIPNPFGPMEEPRFCAYLMRCWANGQVAEVKTPGYVRDNIPIDLLSQAYANFVERYANDDRSSSKLNPCGYVESQGAFAKRFAREIGSRLDLNTPLNLVPQTAFDEPMMRVNYDYVAQSWDEIMFWDKLAEYYRTEYLNLRR